MIDDNTLVNQLVERHESALESVYDRYCSLLYSVALRITGNVENAEEVVQGTFSAMAKGCVFRFQSRLANWTAADDDTESSHFAYSSRTLLALLPAPRRRQGLNTG